MVSLQDFLHILGAQGRKLRIGLFDRRATNCCFRPACDQNLGSILLTMGQIFKILTRRHFGLLPLQVIILEFEPTGRTTVKTTESEFSAVGRPKRVKNPGDKLYAQLA